MPGTRTGAARTARPETAARPPGTARRARTASGNARARQTTLLARTPPPRALLAPDPATPPKDQAAERKASAQAGIAQVSNAHAGPAQASAAVEGEAAAPDEAAATGAAAPDGGAATDEGAATE